MSGIDVVAMRDSLGTGAELLKISLRGSRVKAFQLVA